MHCCKNILAQPNKYKWRDNPPRVTGREMRVAMESAKAADNFSCECWNTKCPNFGDCRKCIVFEACLGHLPTCQKDLYEELKEHYNSYTANKEAVHT
ncbi:MAG TPA: hypothetical protein GXZ77_02730 [Papillibacter sp.]|jgi:hypothetical protein|nr:hypothetical protein [Papillibacter sp.]